MKQEFLRSLNLKVNNIIFNFLLLAWSVFYGVLALPLIIFLPPNKLIEVRKPWIAFIIFLLRRLFCFDYQVNGIENLELQEDFIVASNHQSPLDVLILAFIFKKPAFILKKSLLYIPIFGLYMLGTKMVAVDYSRNKSSVSKIRAMIKKSKELVKQNRTLIIYPEGQRAKVGQNISYKGGVFALYQKLALPVIPVALNAGTVWPIGYFADKKPGKLQVQILKPIPKGLDKINFLKKLKSSIDLNKSDKD